MTYVAQFLQYSNDMPAPNDHLQVGRVTEGFTAESLIRRRLMLLPFPVSSLNPQSLA